MKYTFAAICAIIMVIGITSCNKCYNCTKKCGTCTKGVITVAGCDGDSITNGLSIDAWKAYFESQGYTCAYNNATANDICGADNKKTYTDQHYTCVSK